jgi:hypothetical protein
MKWQHWTILAVVAATVAGGLAEARHLARLPLPQPREWTAHAVAIDDALARNDIDAALSAWRTGRIAALASGRWEDVLAAGDAYRRIGGRAGFRRDTEAQVLYATAFALGRRAGSFTGVLRAGEAFSSVGDRAMVTECLHVAEALAEGDREGQDDVRDFRARFAPWLEAGGVP